MQTELKIFEEVNHVVNSTTLTGQQDFAIQKSTLSMTRKNQEKLYDAVSSDSVLPSAKLKRTHPAKHENIEKALLDWLRTI